MKLMIASDIHGSAYYCRELINAFEREKPDKLLLLGDILYHGPRNELPRDYNPKLVTEMLNAISENIICVCGNCDAAVDRMVLDFEVLADYAYLYIDGTAFFAAHGHKFNEKNPPKLKAGDVLLNGHTHIPKFSECDNFVYANCGSVSIPKEDSPNSYVIFEKHKLSWRTLDGDIFMNAEV